MSSQEPLNLDPLNESYEVIGELPGSHVTRRLLAKRRADDADVLITIAQTPAGDEGNALSHLAADANLLREREYRSLLQILEARWLDSDTLMIVCERVNAPSLEELLARRDEEFDYPRIAAILQEVNGVLDWARSHKVVHRAIDPDSVYVEPGSDRVLVSFVVRPLKLTEMPGPEEDARTIAMLARAMLTRSPADSERANQPLAETRPGLPAQVIEQTEALLTLPRTADTLPDVRGYIAGIAMADALKQGEAEREEVFARERQAFEQEREAIEAALAKQKEAIDEALAKEKEAIEFALEKEREALEKERAALLALDAKHARLTGKLRLPTKRSWKVPLALTGLGLVIAAALLALGRDMDNSQNRKRAVTVSRVADSAAGVAAAPAESVATLRSDTTSDLGSSNPVPIDLVSGVAARAATAPLAAPLAAPPQVSPNGRRPRIRTADSASGIPTRPADSTLRLDTAGLTDSLLRRPVVVPPVPLSGDFRANRDSLRRLRADSTVRRDSVRRDTLVRRDTMPRPN